MTERALNWIIVISKKACLIVILTSAFVLNKKVKKSVDTAGLVRYNGGSLSKSAFPTSTKRKEKRGNLLRSLVRLQNIL